MPRKGSAAAEAASNEEVAKPAAKPAASKAAVDINLPPLSDFDGIEIPEYRTSFTRQQGEGKPPRKFSAKGPKAEAIIRVLFSDQQFTRQQVADICDCSASRVTEIIWALQVTKAEDAPKWDVPTMARATRKKKDDAEATADA